MAKNKIDWVIHAIPEDNGKICLHTHGLNKKGLTELIQKKFIQ